MTLALDNAHLDIGGHRLLSPLSWSFQPGAVTAVLGPNGAGKSSLLSLASGLRQPTGGQALLDRRSLARWPAGLLACRRAVVAQESVVAFDFTAREVVELGRHPHRHRPTRHEAEIVTRSLQATGVLPLDGRAYNTLSGGEKARVQLARALAQIWIDTPEEEGRWLLLDEPTAALDLAHQHQVLACAHDRAWRQGVGVVAVLHDLNLALRYADAAIVLAHGECIAAGPVRQVLDADRIRQVWNIRGQLHASADGTPQFLFEPPVSARAG